MKRLVFIVLTTILLSGRAIAGCDWATETPADDGKYKYFVARVYSETSASDAQVKAEEEINYQLCRLFGAETVTSSEYYSDTYSASGTSRTNQRCVGVHLENFTKEKTGDERSGREYIACVKYKYAISAYNKEIARINAAVTPNGKDVVFNETAGDIKCNDGVGAPLEVVTTPSGAEVYIGGKYRGDTPLKLKNICRGEHQLRIEHDNYEPILEKVIIPTSSGRIAKNLKRATKRVKISADYDKTTVAVNGIKQGRVPVTYVAKMGDTLEITASADGVESAVKHVTVDKYSDDEIKLSLTQKDVKLDFSSWLHRNSGWSVYVDGKSVDSITKITPNERHSLRFSKSGFRTVTDTYSHEPTDNVVYFDRDYTFVPSKSLARTNENEWSWFSGAGTYYFNTKLNNRTKGTVGLSLEPIALRLRSHALYGRIGLAYNIAKVSYGDIKLEDDWYADINAGINFGDHISAFGILGYAALDVDRPKLGGKDHSGKTWYLNHGLGLEYNFKESPFSVRLTYTYASVDLWDKHFVGNNNTKLHKIGLSFHMNWSGLKRMME